MGTLNPQFGTILPSQEQQLLNTNYLQFNTGGANDFIQQYLPEVYEQEVERYGNRTLSGFLRMVGAEMPMTSDQVIWSEQNRLHIAYEGIVRAGDVLTITGNNAIKINNTLVIANGLITAKVLVVKVDGADVTVAPYLEADLDAVFGAGVTTDFKLFVIFTVRKNSNEAYDNVGR